MTPTTSTIQQAGQLSYRKRKYQNSATSDNEEFSDDESSPKTSSPSADDDKRAHHNELERRRRDHIKDHFLNLKSSIPLLEGEKSSRALILKRAVDYITMLQTQIKDYKSEVEDLKRRNENLSQQTSGLNLKPFLTSLQLQQQAAAQPLFNAALSQPQPLVSATNVSVLPTTTHAVAPTTSTFVTDLGGSLTNGLPNISGSAFCQPSKSPQCATPILRLQTTTCLPTCPHYFFKIRHSSASYKQAKQLLNL
ncbi:Protein max [Aphelenchoides bicaudatus]|nr:Protein max [Aphelenchoides bicaudatus]